MKAASILILAALVLSAAELKNPGQENRPWSRMNGEPSRPLRAKTEVR